MSEEQLSKEDASDKVAENPSPEKEQEQLSQPQAPEQKEPQSPVQQAPEDADDKHKKPEPAKHSKKNKKRGSNKPQAHVSEYKKKVVTELEKLITGSEIIGAVNMENLPAQQLQNMMKNLRDKIILVMTKRRLMKIAIEHVKDKKKGIEELVPHLKGMPALLFTSENPFALFKILKKNKSKAPAKAGQTAPSDLVVPAGPTPFAPGPIIGELGSLGIKTQVQEGKITITEDAVVVKEGEEIKPKAAELLSRLNIKPMEIGLDLVAVLEKGQILTKDVLDIDEEEYVNNLQTAARWAFNLAVEAGYPTEETVETMIAKAYNDSRAVALSQEIMADAVVDDILAKAEREALGVKTAGNIETGAKPEQKPVEEKPSEKQSESSVPEQPKPEVKPEEKSAEHKPEPASEQKPGPAPEPEKEIQSKPEDVPKERSLEEKKDEPVGKKQSGKPADENIEDKKIAGMVEEVKKHESPMPSAEDLVEEMKEIDKKEEEPLPDVGREIHQKKQEDVAQQVLKSGSAKDINVKESAESVSETYKGEKEKADDKSESDDKDKSKEQEAKDEEFRKQEEIAQQVLKRGSAQNMK
ncbi:50S ribosomal protein L10 [Candidatus Woesearchaeota archaeon]|nr:50S ribosomal protein L10 [Candidatus Woesearchaeota archaeon]